MTTIHSPEHYRAERLAARAAKYSTQVARLRALAGLPEPSPAATSTPAAGETDRPETTEET